MEKLGIEPVLLAAQIVNFLVILVVLQKLLYKPILGMLEKRKREIAEGVALAQNLREEEEKLKEKQEKALTKAREDALAVIDDAKKQGKEVEKEIISEAHDQAHAILERAKGEAVELHKASEAAIQHEAVGLAVLMAKKLLGSVLSTKEQHLLIEKRIGDLERWVAKAKPSKT
ncbi:MAG TPA: F0F1 ATP synthase subunit B [Patescibacteria group bacterium]|nr:F0F1 ATP synthase subunit B [Patescibacteria group bacterium]